MVLGGRRSPLRALRRSCKKRKTRDHSLLVSAKAEFLLVTVLSCSPCLAAGTKVHLGNFFKWLEYLYLFELFEKTWLTTLLFCHLQLLLSLISSITCFINMSFQDKSVIPRLQRRVFAQEPLNRPPDKDLPQWKKQNQKKPWCLGVFATADFFVKSLWPHNSPTSHPSSFWCFWRRPHCYTFPQAVHQTLFSLQDNALFCLACHSLGLFSVALDHDFSLLPACARFCVGIKDHWRKKLSRSKPSKTGHVPEN